MRERWHGLEKFGFNLKENNDLKRTPAEKTFKDWKIFVIALQNVPGRQTTII